MHTVCLLCQLPAACRNCLPLDALDVLLGAGQAKTSSKEVADIICFAGEHPETFADRSSNAIRKNVEKSNLHQKLKTFFQKKKDFNAEQYFKNIYSKNNANCIKSLKNAIIKK